VIGDQIGAQLDERDRLLAAQNLQYSLESTKNGAVTTWQNPNTGNGGTATPTTTVVKSDGTPCREFTTEIQVGRETQQGYGTACRQADGSWKIQG
jgi:surface antigen